MLVARARCGRWQAYSEIERYPLVVVMVLVLVIWMSAPVYGGACVSGCCVVSASEEVCQLFVSGGTGRC